MAEAAKYRKKPVVIEAMQVRDDLASVYRVADWIHNNGGRLVEPMSTLDGALRIHTLEGDMAVSVGDYVIKGVQGEFYPCKPDIFAATYEAVS